MKKVVFVLHGMGIGGVERSFLGLLRYAPKDDVDVTLLLLSHRDELMTEIPEWIHVDYIQHAGETETVRSNISAFLKKKHLNRLFHIFKWVYHAIGPKFLGKISEKEYDVAIAYNDGIATWYVSKSIRAGKKFAFVHTDFLNSGYNPTSEREIYRCYENIFFGSERSKQSFLSVLPEYQEKLKILTSCVDRERIWKLAGEEISAFEDNVTSILTVGRLSHEKGMEKIPDILKQAKREGMQVKWYIIGDGAERETLYMQAKRLKVEDNMVILGAMKNPYPWIAKCDIYVQPSNYEGYCIALAEARALGKVCVACDFAGAREQLKNGITGFVTGMSSDDIFEKIKFLVQTPDVYRRLQQNVEKENNDARIDAMNYDWWTHILDTNQTRNIRK